MLMAPKELVKLDAAILKPIPPAPFPMIELVATTLPVVAKFCATLTPFPVPPDVPPEQLWKVTVPDVPVVQADAMATP